MYNVASIPKVQQRFTFQGRRQGEVTGCLWPPFLWVYSLNLYVWGGEGIWWWMIWSVTPPMENPGYAPSGGSRILQRGVDNHKALSRYIFAIIYSPSESTDYNCTGQVLIDARSVTSVFCCYTNVNQGRSRGQSVGETHSERRRREALGGFGGMPPQKILKSRGSEMLFPAFSKSYLWFTRIANYFLHCLSKQMHIENSITLENFDGWIDSDNPLISESP